MISGCRFCGQQALLEDETLTQQDAVFYATMECNCEDALQYRNAVEKAELASVEMRNLYRKEIVPDEIIEWMDRNIILMRDGLITEVQCKLRTGKKLKIKYSGFNYSIECSKADKKKVDV